MQFFRVDLQFFRADLQFFRADLKFFGVDLQFFAAGLLLTYKLWICVMFTMLPCMLMREGLKLSMCRHSNEGNPLTEHVHSLYWVCADIIMRGNPLSKTETLKRDRSRDCID